MQDEQDGPEYRAMWDPCILTLYIAQITILLRDAMLARYMLCIDPCVFMSVFSSVCRKSEFYKNGYT